jgi:hypothetical protein
LTKAVLWFGVFRSIVAYTLTRNIIDFALMS